MKCFHLFFLSFSLPNRSPCTKYPILCDLYYFVCWIEWNVSEGLSEQRMLTCCLPIVDTPQKNFTLPDVERLHYIVLNQIGELDREQADVSRTSLACILPQLLGGQYGCTHGQLGWAGKTYTFNVICRCFCHRYFGSFSVTHQQNYWITLTPFSNVWTVIKVFRLKSVRVVLHRKRTRSFDRNGLFRPSS